MAGTIAIQSSQDAFNMLSQIANGKSYMVAEDGKSLQEATLGHKIRQFFGFKSATAENQAVIDLIKDSLWDDPHYSDLVNKMFNGVDTKKAITSDTIKKAFAGFKDSILSKTKGAVERQVTTQLTNILQGELATGKNDGKASVLAYALSGDNRNAEVGFIALKKYLQSAVLDFVNTELLSKDGTVITQADIKQKVTAEINRLYTALQQDKTEDDKRAFAVMVNHLTTVNKTHVAELLRGVDNPNGLATLDKTLSDVDLMQIKNQKQDDPRNSAADVKTRIDDLQNRLEDIVSETHQQSIGRAIDQLKVRLNKVASFKMGSDLREFPARLAQDPEFKKIFRSISQEFRKMTQELCDSFLSTVKGAGDNSDSADLLKAVGDLRKFTEGIPLISRHNRTDIIKTLERIGDCIGKINGGISNKDDHVSFVIKDSYGAEETYHADTVMSNYKALFEKLQELDTAAL